ncbi:hypothetical protein TNCV_820191 [Trichonephila clavipes]|nr:hypothetical protein TNCV_820191 [Trichonephila clavipes]
MYSLGIILIELLLKFKTAAEFSRVLDQVKSEKIPDELNKDWPEFVPLVQNLVQEEPKLRMNAKEVLNMSLLRCNHVEESNALWIKVKDLENALAQKEQQFQQLMEEVKTLRLKLRRVPLRRGVTLNSHRAASLLGRLVEGEDRWEASDPPGCPPSQLGWSQITLSPVWCTKLRLTTGVKLASCR